MKFVKFACEYQQLCTKSIYRRSGNFCVIKFSCFNILYRNIFVVSDTHEKVLTVLN